MGDIEWVKEFEPVVYPPIQRTHLVYLSGPIMGLSYEEATEWRRLVAKKLVQHHIDCLDPMRGKERLQGEERLTNDYAFLGPLMAPHGLLKRDFLDVRRAELVLANVLGAKELSVGTLSEIAWAHAMDKPVVLAMEAVGNAHDHPFVTGQADFWVGSLDAAVDVVVGLLR